MRIEGAVHEQVRAAMGRLLEAQERRYGAVLENHRVLARRPSILRGFRAMWDGIGDSGLLPSRLVDLVNLRVASVIGCGL